MGTHGSFILGGYFTHMLRPKTFIFHQFWGPRVGGCKSTPQEKNTSLMSLDVVSAKVFR